VPVWRYLVERLPQITLYDCDAVAVEMAARLLSQCWLSSDLDRVKELRQWIGKLGMSPADRTRIPAAPTAARNVFTDLAANLDDCS
jgi:hypothetical protein